MSFLKSVLDFLVNNKAFLVSISLLVISELMALIPSLKSNGIVAFLVDLLKKAQPTPPVA